MSHFVNHLHTHLRWCLRQVKGASIDAASSQKTRVMGEHKTYPRMEKIALPPGYTTDALLIPTIQKRQSAQPAKKLGVISLEQMSTLLGAALGCRKGGQYRNYPSGGARYPIETYVITSLDAACGNEVFHYCPTDHVLERLWSADLTNVCSLTNVENGENYSALVVFTSIWNASSAKYGNFSYNLALLEAGHMAQNILLVATAIGLHTRPVCGFNDAPLEQLLNIEPDTEQVVYAVLLG